MSRKTFSSVSLRRHSSFHTFFQTPFLASSVCFNLFYKHSLALLPTNVYRSRENCNFLISPFFLFVLVEKSLCTTQRTPKKGSEKAINLRGKSLSFDKIGFKVTLWLACHLAWKIYQSTDENVFCFNILNIAAKLWIRLIVACWPGFQVHIFAYGIPKLYEREENCAQINTWAIQKPI